MSIGRSRGVLCLLARLLGDLNAVQKGRVGRRLGRRLAGKATGRGLGRLCPLRIGEGPESSFRATEARQPLGSPLWSIVVAVIIYWLVTEERRYPVFDSGLLDCRFPCIEDGTTEACVLVV